MIYIILVISVIIFLISLYDSYKTNIYKKKDKDLLLFDVDYRFKPPPDEINIDGVYDCMGEKLCNVNDKTSCAGCKSFAATCVHFDEDKTIITKQKKITLKKNKTKDEGYCLNIQTLNEKCSPQGDLVLVSTDEKTYKYFLLCMCKNPGAIGNETIDGDCTTVYMCNGKIDDINKPLEKINCICDTGYISDRDKTTKVPYCKEKLIIDEDIEEYVNEEYEKHNIKTTSKDNFHKNIAQNLNISKIKDPCAYCAITGQEVNAETYYDPIVKQAYCREKDSKDLNTFIIVRNKSENIFKVENDDDPLLSGDTVIKLVWSSIVTFYGFEENVINYYICEKNKQKDEYLFLFEDTDVLSIRTGGSILGYDLCSKVDTFRTPFGIKFNLGGAVNTEWSAYVQDISNYSDFEPPFFRHITDIVLPNNQKCPFAFHTGCGTWDTVSDYTTDLTTVKMDRSRVAPLIPNKVLWDASSYAAAGGIVGFISIPKQSILNGVFNGFQLTVSPLIMHN